jgi:flavorubredoxin
MVMKTNRRKGRKAMWIAILVPVGIIVLIAGAVTVGFSIMKHEYGDRREVLKAATANSEKALVVYQPSITSASSDVAHAIAKGLNDGGYEVTLNTPGKHLSADISCYSVVVFGSPNYGGSPGKPLLDYMMQIRDFKGKRILLFSTSGSADGRLEFDKLEALLQGMKPYKAIKLKASDTENNKETAYRLGAATAGK